MKAQGLSERFLFFGKILKDSAILGPINGGPVNKCENEILQFPLCLGYRGHQEGGKRGRGGAEGGEILEEVFLQVFLGSGD